MLAWALSRGLAELYDELVRGTEHCLRRRHAEDRLAKRRGGLRIV
jgi:hypothetical protein